MNDNLEISETLRLLHAQETLPPADQLKRLWEIPEKVPEDFRIPEGVRLALASGSDFKQKNVTEVWNSLGGQGIIVTKSEDESMIQAFLAHNTDARLLPSPGHLLPGVPHKAEGVPDNLSGEHDGFFYALLEKQPG